LRCRALRDGAVGWVAAGTAGAAELAPGDKPFLLCASGATLRAGEAPESAALRGLGEGEALEVLEGPRSERPGPELRVRGVACGEGLAGWLQLRDAMGTALAEPRPELQRCSEALALTDIADLRACGMVRRVDAGEVLEPLPEPEVRPAEGGERRRFRACRDGAEGWVTTKGAQGKLYVSPAPRHYLVLQPTQLHAALGATGAPLRELLPGQAFAAFEEPKEVPGNAGLASYRVRTLTDGLEGWASSGPRGPLLPWRTRCTLLCTSELLLDSEPGEGPGEGAGSRPLEAGEALELLGRPAEDSATGRVLARCSLPDGASGWLELGSAGDGGAEAPLLRPAGEA